MTVETFDFTFQTSIRLSTLGSLLGPEFVSEGRCVVLHGSSGTGKTHLAIALRATSAKSLRTAAKKNGRDDSIFDFLTEERDPSGFKYRIPFDVQVDLFRFAIDRIEARIVPALCKEDQALWRALGLAFRGCHCLLDGGDALVGKAPANVQALREGDSEPDLVRLRGRAAVP